MTQKQLTIIGPGLIGGSVALSARRAGMVSKIVAIDREPGSHPMFDDWVVLSDQARVESSLVASDFTFLCTPVGAIMELLPEVLKSGNGIVTDCGSTKGAISRAASGLSHRSRFVPGHPMAGRPEGGLENAAPDLFAGRKWVLCSEQSDPQRVFELTLFLQALGAEIVTLSAEAHDQAVALISHVPQVVASILAKKAAEQEALGVAGPGFDSATRVAGGAESMWRDIFATNGAPIGKALVEIGTALCSLGQELSEGEIQGVLTVLEAARKRRK